MLRGCFFFMRNCFGVKIVSVCFEQLKHGKERDSRIDSSVLFTYRTFERMQGLMQMFGICTTSFGVRKLAWNVEMYGVPEPPVSIHDACQLGGVRNTKANAKKKKKKSFRVVGWWRWIPIVLVVMTTFSSHESVIC